MSLILLLSGPNLNLLGQRQPLIYGPATLDDLVQRARATAEKLGHEVEHVQSNHEGALVDAVHAARGRAAAIIVNGAALTHYGWSLHDALLTFEGPIVELHISNPERREDWRRTSVLAPAATGTIQGFGAHGYELAVEAVARLLAGDTPADAAADTPAGGAADG